MSDLTPQDALPGRVFAVDDDPTVLRTLERVLARAGNAVEAFDRAPALLDALEASAGDADVVISDLHMPELDGFGLLERIKARWPDIPVLIVSADSSARSAVQAMHRGAYDYLVKPFEAYEHVILVVSRAQERSRLVRRNRTLERQLDVGERFEGIVGRAPAMKDVFRLVESVAPTDATVLLLGESGTGKELLARALHARSLRKARPFIPVNCSALPETLLESELFGHARGAFTGATTSRPGLFEEANGGTLFLDEIGDVSAATQVRFLRALQEGEIRPVGSNEVRRVDTRVIAATNRDLKAAVRAGRFREDLYYRLDVVSIELPPLRRRGDDVVDLAHHFLTKYARKHRKPVTRFEPNALDLMRAHSWPGNVRELENAVQRAVVLAVGDAVTAANLPAALTSAVEGPAAAAAADLPFTQARRSMLEAFEHRYVESVLRRSGGNAAEAARIAGLDRSNFRRLVRRHGLDLGRFRAGDDKRPS